MFWRNLIGRLILLVLMAILSGKAIAQTPQVRVIVLNNSGTAIVNTTFPQSAPISFSNVNSTWSRMNVFTDNAPATGFASIGPISLSGTNPPPATLHIVIGAGGIPTSFNDLGLAGTDWNGISVSGGTMSQPLRDRVTVHRRISGDLTGAIQAGGVGFLEIGDQIQASISLNGGVANASVRASSIVAAGDITSFRGISLVQTTGNSAGDIHSTGPNGELDQLLVGGSFSGAIDVVNDLRIATIGGTFGTLLNPLDVGVGGRIGVLTADEINMDLQGFGGFTRSDRIHRLIARSGGGASGKVRGTVRTRALISDVGGAGFISAPGGLDADVVIREGLDSGQFSISAGSAGIIGQIVVGEQFDVGIAEDWTGSITVGGVELLPKPAYSNSHTSIGGGAVGLMPFQLHATDCWPAIGECIARTAAPDINAPIEMRHYGPVTWNAASHGVPFRIERRAIGLSGTWIDQTACFTQTLDPSNDTVVVLTPGECSVPGGDCKDELQAGFEYRVVLRHIGDNPANEFVLRSKTQTGPANPEVAAHTSEFAFSVGDPSLGDANNDGTVNFADETSILGNWQTTDCLAFGDADRDGDVDFGDITEMLENWLNNYSGCTPPGGGSMMMASAGPSEGCNRTMAEALPAMGFASAAEFQTWLATLDKSQQELVLTGIDEWLECLR